MTTPLTPPTFGDKYNVGLTDIGSGYAAGITSAGQSIAGAIGAVMGGINQKTGEVEPGLLDQKKSSEDMLDMLHLHGMLSDDEYAKAKTSGLSAQQKLIGVTAADFNYQLKSNIEQQNAQKTALAQIQAQNQGAMSRTQYSEQQTTQRSQAQLEAENKRLQMQLQAKVAENPYVGNAPTPVPPAATPNQPAPLKLFPGNQ
jgi:hypothetical protein